MDKYMEDCLCWILMEFLSPIAVPILILMALLSLLRFLLKALLLFIIVAIHTPFAVMYNLSMLVYIILSSDRDFLEYCEPRASVGIELQTIVSDFFKVIAGELLLVLSTGVITFYTTPKLVFYISMTVGVAAIFLKWLNTSSLSKTAFACLCDGYGLNPMMYLFSFMGLFDIGCHPIAKCSFTASKAFLFLKAVPNQSDGDNGWHQFNGKSTIPENPSIKFFKWNAFERGLFQLSPKIDFIKKPNKPNKPNVKSSEKYILKCFMVLRLLQKVTLCKYPMERLELSEDYSKANELYNFLLHLSKADGFVTDKMRGRYEHSLTLLEIVDGIQQSLGYRVVDPMDNRFVVSGCFDLQ